MFFCIFRDIWLDFFSVLLASAAGLDSSPWLVASGFASVSLSDLGFASADGVSATTSLAFSSGLAALAASAVSVVAASLLAGEAVSDAVATPSAFSSLFSLACSLHSAYQLHWSNAHSLLKQALY